MDLIKLLLDESKLPDTIKYRKLEHKLTDGKDIDEKNRISDELSEMVYAEQYAAFKAGFYMAIDLITGGKTK